MEEAAHPARIRRDAARGEGIRVLRCALQSTCAGVISLRRLQQRTVRFKSEIRLRHGLAELLRSNRRGKCAREKRFQRRRAANGSQMHGVRRAFGACLPRRTGADRLALLHELGGAALYPPKKLKS